VWGCRLDSVVFLSRGTYGMNLGCTYSHIRPTRRIPLRIQKTLITNKCTKTFLSIVTHSYMFRPCWVIFRENFLFFVKLRLHLQAETTESSRLQKQRSTQSTAYPRSTVKCNLSVTKTESSPWRWPSRVETCRSVLQLIKKLFVHLLVIHVFCIIQCTDMEHIKSDTYFKLPNLRF
jgi:hypothetical protein